MAAAARKKRSHSSTALRVVLGSTVALVVLAAMLWLLFGGNLPSLIAPGAVVDFDVRLVELAAANGVEPESIRADDPIRKVDGIFVRHWAMQTSNEDTRAQLITALTEEVHRRGGRMGAITGGDGRSTRIRIDLDREAFEVAITARPRPAAVPPTPRPTRIPTPTPRPEPAPNARGRLAIILDDGGQSMDLVAAAAALPKQVSVSVLPFLPYSSDTAAAMHRSGHEVWLHLPMEPEDYPESKPGPGAVMVGMNESEIRSTVHAALNNIPHVVGVNNHMGSRATAELRTMTWVMQELKARGMAFVDSRTTVDTTAELAARAQGVPVGRRHVFLDNQRTRSAVRAQLDEAVYLARLNGECIAIGHLTQVTVQVLAAELPGVDARGADLVPPTKLVK